MECFNAHTSLKKLPTSNVVYIQFVSQKEKKRKDAQETKANYVPKYNTNVILLHCLSCLTSKPSHGWKMLFTTFQQDLEQ